MSNSRIYLVRSVNEAQRLVRATNPAQAIRHVARAEITATVATQDDLVNLLPTHKIEEASASGEGEAERDGE